MINSTIAFFNFNKKVNIAPLVVFRILFGALLIYSTSRFMLKGWVYDMYIQPSFFFGYYGFEWVKPLAGKWMYLPFITLLIGALGIMIGAFYRLSSILAFLSFSYIELLDKTNYLNHYYFISLMCFLFILVPANRSFSMDVKWKIVPPLNQVFYWHIGVFKFQLAVVYIFAGIAKLHSDWLFEAQPLMIWLQAHRDMPLIGSLLKEKWIAYIFSWFGCAYDLLIVFFLINNKTRRSAYLAVVIFHLITWFLLPIGVFPWVMILSTTIFFSVSFHEKILSWLKRIVRYRVEEKAKEIKKSVLVRVSSIIVVLFIVIQLAVPFRFAFYPGNLFWNEEGFRFSWRVMLMHKEGLANFYIIDKQTKRTIEIDNKKYLTEIQIDQMSTQPDMLLQYAQHLNEIFKDTIINAGSQSFHIVDPKVSAEVFVSLNGRSSQLYVSKKHDLSKIPYNLAHRNWLEPYKE